MEKTHVGHIGCRIRGQVHMSGLLYCQAARFVVFLRYQGLVNLLHVRENVEIVKHLESPGLFVVYVSYYNRAASE